MDVTLVSAYLHLKENIEYQIITGIIYNNQMDDFSKPGSPNFYGYAPSPANFIKPCKLDNCG